MVLGLLVLGGPAAADPAGPTHFRSTVTEVVVADDGPVAVEVEVLGGDAFLVVRAEPGTEVEVPGYEGEPYVRIAADGTVEANTRSPARWLNDARFGALDVDIPPQADVDAPPQWEVVARDGEYAWHDHRIHFMSPALPPSVDASRREPQQVSDWSVPLMVDGREVQLRGELEWLPGPSPVLPMGAVLVTAAAGAWLGLRRATGLPAAIAVGAVLTGGVGLSASLGLPAGADAEPALVVLPALSIGVLLAARLWARRDAGQAAWMTPAAGLPIAVWGIVQWGALTRPIVPGPLPSELVLVTVAIAFGLAIAALVVVGRQVLHATALDPDTAG
jgi:hypothetical protein